MNESIVDAHYRIGISIKEIFQLTHHLNGNGNGSGGDLSTLQNEYKTHIEMTLIMRNNLDSMNSTEEEAGEALIQKRKEFLRHYNDSSSPLMDSTMIYCDEALRLSAIGEYDSADNMFQRCIFVRERKLGRNSSYLTPILFLHAEFLCEIGQRKGDVSKIDLACLEIERCIAINSSHFGSTDESVQRFFSKLAQIYIWKSEKYNNLEDLMYARNITANLLSVQLASMGSEHNLTKETAVALNAIDLQISKVQRNREQTSDQEPLQKSASLTFTFVYNTEMAHNFEYCQKVLSVSKHALVVFLV